MAESKKGGWDVLRTLADCDDEHAKVAERFLDEIGIRGARQRELLLPLISESVLIVRRSAVLSLEKRIFRNGATNRRLLGEVIDSIEDRRALFASTFALPDGRRVTWAEATILDHQLRVAMLLKLRGGIDVTISRHEQAIALIANQGATCLGDIEDAA